MQVIPSAGLEYCETTGLLYAYHWDSNTREELFLSIDPTSAKLSRLGVIPTITHVTGNSAMRGTDYYSIMLNSGVKKLVHVSVAGGGFTVNMMDFDVSEVSGGTQVIPSAGLEYCETTGLLYAYDWDSNTREELFLSIDPTSAKLSRLGVIPTITHVTGNSAMRGTDYYSIMLNSGVKKLVHVSVAGGGFTVNVMDFDVSEVTGGTQVIPSAGLEYCETTGLLYAYDWDSNTREELFLSIDPTSAKLSRLGVIPTITQVPYPGSSAMRGTHYYSIMLNSGGKKLVHVDIPTGSCVTP